MTTSEASGKDITSDVKDVTSDVKDGELSKSELLQLLQSVVDISDMELNLETMWDLGGYIIDGLSKYPEVASTEFRYGRVETKTLMEWACVKRSPLSVVKAIHEASRKVHFDYQPHLAIKAIVSLDDNIGPPTHIRERKWELQKLKFLLEENPNVLRCTVHRWDRVQNVMTEMTLATLLFRNGPILRPIESLPLLEKYLTTLELTKATQHHEMRVFFDSIDEEISGDEIHNAFGNDEALMRRFFLEHHRIKHVCIRAKKKGVLDVQIGGRNLIVGIPYNHQLSTNVRKMLATISSSSIFPQSLKGFVVDFQHGRRWEESDPIEQELSHFMSLINPPVNTVDFSSHFRTLRAVSDLRIAFPFSSDETMDEFLAAVSVGLPYLEAITLMCLPTRGNTITVHGLKKLSHLTSSLKELMVSCPSALGVLPGLLLQPSSSLEIVSFAELGFIRRHGYKGYTIPIVRALAENQSVKHLKLDLPFSEEAAKELVNILRDRKNTTLVSFALTNASLCPWKPFEATVNHVCRLNQLSKKLSGDFNVRSEVGTADRSKGPRNLLPLLLDANMGDDSLVYGMLRTRPDLWSPPSGGAAVAHALPKMRKQSPRKPKRT